MTWRNMTALRTAGAMLAWAVACASLGKVRADEPVHMEMRREPRLLVRSLSPSMQAHWMGGGLCSGRDPLGTLPVQGEWQRMPSVDMRTVQAPAGGPLVLLGIAALVGGPRQRRCTDDRPARGA